ncbi:MAG: hypothetical protein ACOC44_12205 [Promethearchaeia archaeon]
MKPKNFFTPKLKYALLLMLSLAFIFTIPSVKANNDSHLHQDKLREGSSMFFVVALEKGETLELKLKPYENGEFYLFLFDKRPSNTYVKPDKTLEGAIYDRKVAYDQGENPKITYTAKKERIFYIQVICMEGNYFQIESNKELTRYYIPQIDGYNPCFLICTSIILIGLAGLILKKRGKFKYLL